MIPLGLQILLYFCSVSKAKGKAARFKYRVIRAEVKTPEENTEMWSTDDDKLYWTDDSEDEISNEKRATLSEAEQDSNKLYKPLVLAMVDLVTLLFVFQTFINYYWDYSDVSETGEVFKLEFDNINMNQKMNYFNQLSNINQVFDKDEY